MWIDETILPLCCIATLPMCMNSWLESDAFFRCLVVSTLKAHRVFGLISFLKCIYVRRKKKQKFIFDRMEYRMSYSTYCTFKWNIISWNYGKLRIKERCIESELWNGWTACTGVELCRQIHIPFAFWAQIDATNPTRLYTCTLTSQVCHGEKSI